MLNLKSILINNATELSKAIAGLNNSLDTKGQDTDQLNELEKLSQSLRDEATNPPPKS